jgi:hypothetical protein
MELPFKTLNAFNDLRTCSFSCDTKVPTFGFDLKVPPGHLNSEAKAAS